jgi:Rad3-related DNA helicase
VVFTSATLAVDGGFDFFLTRSGAGYLEDLRSERVESPFDFDRQARLMIPTHLPEPLVGSQDFPLAFSAMVNEAIHATRGRAMVLFTSHRMLREVAEALRPRLEEEGLEVLQQQVDGPREALLARFRRNVHSVLLGTASFWEGVDVKGESLSLLILAKLPFPVHTDPLIQARQDNEALKGNDPFIHYLLPLSVLRLRQGFGRLIRSKRDRGVVIVADKRLLTRRYGGTFLRSLPTRHRVFNSPKVLTRHLERFFATHTEGDEVEYYFDDEFEEEADL